MMKQLWLLDENNFWTGKYDFVQEVTEGMTDIPLINAFVKSQLVKGEWAEGATEEEIAEWKQAKQIDICPEPPPTNEELHNQLVETQKLCLNLQKQILLK